jgi:hypothetical protein
LVELRNPIAEISTRLSGAVLLSNKERKENIMGLALEKSGRMFGLHTRCVNCLKDTTIEIFMPYTEGAIDAVDLAESAALGNVPFSCARCGGVIGQIVGVTKGPGV